MTRVATPDNEEFLIMIARHGTADHMEKLVRKFSYAKRVSDKSFDFDEWWRTAKFNFWQDVDGMFVFSGRLPAEDGALIIKAIECVTDEIERDKAEDKTLSADELASENRKQLSQETNKNVSAETLLESEEGASDYTTHEVKRADALTYIAEHYLATSHEGVKSSTGTDKYQVLLHINTNPQHIDHKIQGGSPCYLEQGRFLAPEVAKRLSCDASLTLVSEDDDGNVLNIGRRSRIIPAALRKALMIRDSSCRFPGCSRNKWLDAHHIQHWADGGDTSLSNTLMLCRYHHGLLHKGEYRIERAEGGLVFVNKDNIVMKQAFYPQFDPGLASVEALELAHQSLGLKIDSETATTLWCGERMDYDDAVLSMVDYEFKHDSQQSTTPESP